MSALNVFLAVMGVGVTGLVVAGMILLQEHHLISPAPQTELPDSHEPPSPPSRRARGASAPDEHPTAAADTR